MIGTQRRDIGLYFRTARNLKLLQIIHRLRFLVTRHVLPSRRIGTGTGGVCQFVDLGLSSDALLARRDFATCLTRADSVVAGVFHFAGEEMRGSPIPNWDAPGKTRLFRFQLHYFDYAYDLAIAYARTSDIRYFERFRELVEAWLRCHSRIRGDAWHPYPTSRRIVNWILAAWLFRAALVDDRGFRERLGESVCEQSRYLFYNLERDVLANHLLENLCALWIASRAFADRWAERWGHVAQRLLCEQLGEQILDDGGHYERSPTYHCEVLRALLDCLLVARGKRDPLEDFLQRVAVSMVGFLKNLVYPNGDYPLFNDAAFDLAWMPTELFSYGERLLPRCQWNCPDDEDQPGLVALPESGYTVLEAGGMRVVVDAGPLGPSYQAGHGHCDLLSYEVAIGGELLIADTGTPTYEPGPLRDYARSTAAHSTVTIDGAEQAELWGSFRVGRRASPVLGASGRDDQMAYLTAWHDGFRKLPGRPVHQRSLLLSRAGVLLVVDLISGRGEHDVDSFIHFHPDAILTEQGAVFRISRGACAAVLVFDENADVRQDRGIRAERIGQMRGSNVLRLHKRCALPIAMACAMAPEDLELESVSVSAAGTHVDVHARSGTMRATFRDGQWLWKGASRVG